jgi:hypothetical protein
LGLGTEWERNGRSHESVPVADATPLATDQEQGSPAKPPVSPAEALSELEARYPTPLVSEARGACALSRRNGKMSDSVWLATLQALSAHPADAVERSMRLFVERYADGEKDERYLLGIVRKDVKPRALSPGRVAPSAGTTGKDFEDEEDLNVQMARWNHGSK